MGSFKWWVHGSGMTEELVKLQITGDGVYPIVFGSDDAGQWLREDTDRGVNDIIITPADADPGNGHEVSEFQLSLDDVTYEAVGNPISLGPVINGGVEVVVYLKFTNATGIVADPNLLLSMNAVYEDAIP